MKNWFRSRTIRIPLIYAIFSVVWIIVTDQINYLVNTDTSRVTEIAIIKGTVFVLISSLIIYLLLRADEKHEASLQTELKVVQDSFSYLFSRNPLPMWMNDPEEGQFLAVNESACKLYGYQPTELVNKKLKDLCEPADYEKLLVDIRKEAATLQPSGPWRQFKTDGATIYVNFIAVPIQLSGRGVILVTAFDVSLQREMETALKTTEIQRDDYEAFSYSISHDLRAPLRLVNGYSQLLLMDYAPKLDAKGQEYIQAMVHAGDEMNQMIDNLLILTRLKRSSLKSELVDLAALTREIMDQISSQDPGRKIEFSAPEKVLVKTDPALMKNLLQNLLENAWKFTAERETARIEFGFHEDTKEGRVYFVKDNGLGFDMKEVFEIFKPFKKLNDPSEFSGSGVGLSIVSRIIERFNGRVWAESKPGKGAAFYFTLGQD
jgi:PAS domain S-box-containing protein